MSIPVHHFLHVIMLAGAAFSALLFTVPVALRQGKAIWLVAAVVTPLLAMFLMWPSSMHSSNARRYFTPPNISASSAWVLLPVMPVSGTPRGSALSHH